MSFAASDPRVLVFLHIPKAAGSTLRPVLERKYDEREVFHHNYFKPESRKFQSLRRSRRKKIRCLMGHFPYGIHEYLSRPVEYVTMLRNPVERVLSNYYYILRTPSHRLYDILEKEDISLCEYISGGVNPLIENGMVRFISGEIDGTPNQNTLQKAKTHLRNDFGTVGIVEQFDVSLILMKRRYGWANTTYRKRNVTSNRPRKRDIQDDILELIRDRNQLDIQLYRWVKSRFDEEVSKVDMGADLRLHRLRCRAYSAVKYWSENARRVKRTLLPY